MSACLPLSEDEIYYDAWARDLSLSYFDHPPMVAVLIRLSTSLWGHSPFGVRFFAAPIATIIVASLASLTSRRLLLTLALFSPTFLWAALITTPDTPLLLFWTLYFLWSVRVATCFSGWSDDPIARVYRPSPLNYSDWCLGGTLLGLGMLSKYTMFFAPVCLLLNLIRHRLSSWWRGYLLHASLALVFFVPVIIFNHRHGYSPLHFQWNHTTGSDTELFRFFGNYVLSQVLLIGLMPFLLIPWQFLRLKEVLDYPLLRTASLFFLVPFLFVLFQATHLKVEANWSLMAYISFWILVQCLLDNASFRMESTLVVWISFFPSLLVSILMAAHLVFPLPMVSPSRDRPRRLTAQHEAFKQIRSVLQNHGNAPVFATTYQNTAQLRYSGVPAEQVPGIGRPSHFTLKPTNPCSHPRTLVVQETPEHQFPCFETMEPIASIPVIVRNETVHTYYLVQYTGSK